MRSYLQFYVSLVVRLSCTRVPVTFNMRRLKTSGPPEETIWTATNWEKPTSLSQTRIMPKGVRIWKTMDVLLSAATFCCLLLLLGPTAVGGTYLLEYLLDCHLQGL